MAAAAALLTCAGVANGLAILAPVPQAGLFAGAAAALAAGRPLPAMLAAATGAVAAFTLLPLRALHGPGGRPDPAGLAVLIAFALAASGGLGAWLARRAGRGAGPAVLVVVALLLANLWTTTLRLDSVARPGGGTALEALARRPAAGATLSDNEFYQRVLWMVDGGQGYYDAFRQAYRENARWKRDPDTAMSYRLPVVFWWWSALPGKPLGLVVGFLAVATLAIAAAAWLAAQRAGASLAVPSAALLAGYLLFPATTNALLLTEPWAVGFALAGIAAAVASHRAPDRAGWLALAVTATVLATLVRETMAFLFVAGLGGALAATGSERRRRLAWWGGGALAVTLAYAAHVAAVADRTGGAHALAPWLRGGFETLVLGLRWSSGYAGGLVVLAACAGLSLFGALRVPDRALRVYAALVVLVPLAMLWVFGNGAYAFRAGEPVNYWGTLAGPVVIALAPWAAAGPGAPAGRGAGA